MNKSPYKISGDARRELKKELADLKSYKSNYYWCKYIDAEPNKESIQQDHKHLCPVRTKILRLEHALNEEA